MVLAIAAMTIFPEGDHVKPCYRLGGNVVTNRVTIFGLPGIVGRQADYCHRQEQIAEESLHAST